MENNIYNNNTDNQFLPPDPPKLKKRKLWMGILFLITALFVVCIMVFVPLITEKSQTNAIIKIPADASLNTVKDSIAKYMGKGFAEKVSTVARIRSTDFSSRHGAFMIDSGMSPFQAERRLAKGGQVPFNVTVNAARLPENIADKVTAKLEMSPDSLLNYLKTSDVLEKYGLSQNEIQSLFIDDTYQFFWNASPQTVVKKFGDHYNKIWNEERRHKAEALALTPAQVMIISSIVDEETNKASDKGKIGRLYINRLHKGMKLQADPTVKYAIGDFSIRRIRNNHLETKSPYNTYEIVGLPPGPIRTTSVATIDSVLNSQPHTYLYMCAKDDFSGYHAFATTYSEHLVNARKYQQALNRRGIK